MKTKNLYLGVLGLQEQFKIPPSEIIYETITYGPSSLPYIGTRWCYNTHTHKAEWKFCRTKVIKVSRGNN